MDAKDLRTESALSERNNDGNKYSPSGVALQCNRNKTYQDIGSNPLGKTEPAAVRPCAVIGPDRVVPPPNANDAYLKKGLIEPWTCPDNMYSRPPDYPHKISNTQNPTRNISPRQTFQENMQRIMVPPSYNTVKHTDDTGFTHVQERNPVQTKNAKPNNPSEGKYCEVPYTINQMTNEHKNLRDPEMCMPSVNSPISRTAPHMWPPSSVNLHAPRAYGAHELYQYPQYSSCAGPRQPIMPMVRSHRPFQDEPGYVYSAETFYQDPNMRFKPYPPVKERYPQPRYEYIGNYPNPFHPAPPFPPHKYEIPKSGQTHPYPLYPHLKYVDNRLPDSSIEAYQRPPNPPPNYNMSFRNQVLHSNYANSLGNAQNKVLPFPVDSSGKPIIPNKGPYDNNNKVYIDYENARSKTYPMSDTYFVNEMSRTHPNKGQGMMPPNYPGVHQIPPQQFYRKDMPHIKSHEYMPHFRNFDPSMNAYSVMRHPPQFSPNTIAISPTDSIASNDTIQTHGTNQEDCGYVSQSSTASIRSLDSGTNRMSSDYFRRHDYRYGLALGNSPMHPKSDFNTGSNNKKQIDVRQFLQMWNEGDEENAENNGTKEIIIQTGNSNNKTNSKDSQEQLYVLGLVNVPSEELGKYEHIQKVSKLPENIKGYNSIELLNQFEEAIESSKVNSFKSPSHKEFQMPLKENRHMKQVVEVMPRPLSPLDVEAKISQSVIHKEVGCNFEIKPCSPKMLNVEVAAPIQNILGERVIEKVSNPLSKIIKSPISNRVDDSTISNNNKKDNIPLYENPSCKMVGSPFSRNSTEPVKTNYSLQDLETNSGVCLASLPRLDNEIELHFPEVNQQFIDANKMDSNVMFKNPLHENKELLRISGSTCGKDTNQEEGIQNHNKPLDSTENEYVKLSKYRKSKGNPVEQCEDATKTHVIRTDSVIIKNPDNVKKYDECKTIDFTQLVEDNDIAPVNLSSQTNFNAKNNSDIELFDRTNSLEPIYSEDALDFSMNKTEHFSSVINTNKLHEVTMMASSDEISLRKDDNIICKESECLETTGPKENVDDTATRINENKMETDINLDDMLNSVAEKVVSAINDSHNLKPSLQNSESLDNYSNINSTLDYSNIEHKKTESKAEERMENTIIYRKETPIVDFDNDLLTNNIDNIVKDERLDDKNLVECNNAQPEVIKSNEDSCNIEQELFEISEKTELIKKDYVKSDEERDSPKESINHKNDDLIDNVTNEDHVESAQSTSSEVESHKEQLIFPDDSIACDSSVNQNDQEETRDAQSDTLPDNICETDSNHNLKSSVSDLDEINTCIQEDNKITEMDIIDESFDNHIRLESTELKNNNSVNKKIHRANLSKELNSPWVQKLLLHSEGLLSGGLCNKIEQKTCSVSTIMDEENDSNVFDDKEICGESENEPERYIAINNAETDINMQDDSDTNDSGSDTCCSSSDSESSSVEIDSSNISDQCEAQNDQVADCKSTNYSTAENSNLDEFCETKHQENSHEEAESLDKSLEGKDNTLDEIKNIPLEKQCIPQSPCLESTITENEIVNQCNSNIILPVENFPEDDENLTLENERHIDSKLNDVHSESMDRITDTDSCSIEKDLESDSAQDQPEVNDVIDENMESEAIEDVSALHTEIEPKDISYDISNNENINISSIIECNNESGINETKKSIKDSTKFDNSSRRGSRTSLKRSFSDSDLSTYNNKEDKNVSSLWPSKRKKIDDTHSFERNIAENLCRIINNNRRNSISSIHNEDVSFCILIEDNCIITEESEETKICFAEFTENCVSDVDSTNQEVNSEFLADVAVSPDESDCEYSNSIVADTQDHKSDIEEPWVDDVACVETVISDDVAEDVVISTSSTPERDNISEFDESGVFCNSLTDHTDKVKSIYGENMSDDDAQIVDTLFRTPQMDVNKTLVLKDSMHCEDSRDIYDETECLENILSESDNQISLSHMPETLGCSLSHVQENVGNSLVSTDVPISSYSKDLVDDDDDDISAFSNNAYQMDTNILKTDELRLDKDNNTLDTIMETQVDTVHSCESSVDNVFNYKQKDDDIIYSSSSSPEVSSTTSEEKNSSILLKITNYNGSRISEINEIKPESRPRCKFTEKKEYSNANFPNRPLLTKAAQKYIPPIKETIRDLKVKISLPQQSLLKLKQLKLTKHGPKIVNKQNSVVPVVSKKPKPNFEDVLKSIDEIQFKMHKEKNKKSKNTIPKVVIKKNENGSHYASTSDKETYNPDLTDRKWQPWVFLEKNDFIDKMALRNKTRAIYNHRKNTYVLKEKFKKYKSVSSAKFVISQPKSSDSMGHLKYTIRLKHSY